MNQKQWILLATLTAALLLVKGSSIMARGIRNNNPANIRGASYQWLGEVGRDNQNFVVFSSPVYGIRAAYRVLQTYRNKYGLMTPSGIINRWAPPNENNTSAYVAHVANTLGVGEHDAITLDKYPELIKVIIKHENGVQPYSDEVIHAGIAAA